VEIITVTHEWMSRADCNNLPSAWWTETDMSNPSYMWKTTENEVAVEICRTCPVRDDCLIYCLDNERTGLPHRWGIYAGITPANRHKLQVSLSA
jgi:hypothetical protein